MILGPGQKFHNSTKEIVQSLKGLLPKDVFVGTQVPSKRLPKMVIVIDGGGSMLSEITRSQRINLMCWSGNTWEQAADFCYEVDTLMASLSGKPYSQIIYVERAILPVPSGDGESAEVPVYSSAYDLVIASTNAI